MATCLSIHLHNGNKNCFKRQEDVSIVGGALYGLEDGGLPADKCIFLRLGRRTGQTRAGPQLHLRQGIGLSHLVEKLTLTQPRWRQAQVTLCHQHRGVQAKNRREDTTRPLAWRGRTSWRIAYRTFRPSRNFTTNIYLDQQFSQCGLGRGVPWIPLRSFQRINKVKIFLL